MTEFDEDNSKETRRRQFEEKKKIEIKKKNERAEGKNRRHRLSELREEDADEDLNMDWDE